MRARANEARLVDPSAADRMSARPTFRDGVRRLFSGELVEHEAMNTRCG